MTPVAVEFLVMPPEMTSESTAAKILSLCVRRNHKHTHTVGANILK
jgi:hypothetical protein